MALPKTFYDNSGLLFSVFMAAVVLDTVTVLGLAFFSLNNVLPVGIIILNSQWINIFNFIIPDILPVLDVFGCLHLDLVLVCGPRACGAICVVRLSFCWTSKSRSIMPGENYPLVFQAISMEVNILYNGSKQAVNGERGLMPAVQSVYFDHDRVSYSSVEKICKLRLVSSLAKDGNI